MHDFGLFFGGMVFWNLLKLTGSALSSQRGVAIS